MAVFFNGRLLITPTTATAVNDDAMRNQNLATTNTVALIGLCDRGQPKTPLRFGSPTEAQKALVSGELLEAVLAAFSPSAETAGPGEVVVLRVNPATSGTGTMLDSTGAVAINLTSTDYGVGENEINYKVEAGTLAGVRITTKRNLNYYTKDNIARSAFNVHYVGTETTATIDITGTEVKLSAPAGTVVATIDLNNAKNVLALVERINAVPNFIANVLDGNAYALALNGLDYVTAASVKSTYTVRADLQAAIDWINSGAEEYLTATRGANAGKPPAPAVTKFITGATSGVSQMSDWVDCFEVLQGIDVQWFVPLSDDEAIHAMADAHALYMSTIGKRERRCIVGTELGTSDEAAVELAKSINSDRTSLIHLGHYNYDSAGALTLFPPYITAALVGGMFAGVNPGTPLTNKTIRVRGLERNLRVPTDTDLLISNGVFCIESSERGYKVVRSISTWLTSENYNRVEQSCGTALDFVSRSVRDALDALRGQKGNPLIISRAGSIVESTLRELAREEPVGPGILAGDAFNPAYRNITASLEGDVLRVEFECSPVIPVNYVLATIYAVPFTGTATIF